MKPDKKSCVVLALTMALLGPLDLARPQEERTPTQTPQTAETVEEEGQSPLAIILTAVNFPLRGVACGMASSVAAFLMVFSAGMNYADAAKMIEQGCSGPWIITPQMIDEGRPTGKDGNGVVSRGDKRP